MQILPRQGELFFDTGYRDFLQKMSVADKFKEHHVVPDVISNAPKEKVEVN